MRAAAAVNSSAFRILQGKCNGMTIFSWRGLQKKKGAGEFRYFGFCWLEQEDNLPLACGAFTAKAKLWFLRLLLFLSTNFPQISCCFPFFLLAAALQATY